MEVNCGDRICAEVGMPENILYLAVLPVVRMGIEFGRTEQILTLLPMEELATQFFPDEVEGYVLTFQRRANEYLVGGHVQSYEFQTRPTSDGRVIVRVVQNVR
jgi:hypothetical protein